MNIKIKPIHKYTWIGMILIIVGLVSFSNYPYIGNGVIFIGAIIVSIAIFTGKNVEDK